MPATALSDVRDAPSDAFVIKPKATDELSKSTTDCENTRQKLPGCLLPKKVSSTADDGASNQKQSSDR